MTLNNVRVPLECRLEIVDPQGKKTEYVLNASCKSEQVWVQHDVWHQPNADMSAIASSNEFCILKRWDKYNKGVMRYPETLGVQPERQVVEPNAAFDRFSIDMHWVSVHELETIDEILTTLFSGQSVIARTEYKQNGYSIMIEYPVKAVNFSERERFYQVDTGPIIFPDFASSGTSLIEKLQVAYIAHNCPQWAEMIVCVPTALNENDSVWHFSKSVRITESRNSLLAVE